MHNAADEPRRGAGKLDNGSHAANGDFDRLDESGRGTRLSEPVMEGGLVRPPPVR